MARGYEPHEFTNPQEVSEERRSTAEEPSQNEATRHPAQADLGLRDGLPMNPAAVRSRELRKVYEIRGSTYRLRTTEILTMVDLGKFRVIAEEDLTEFAYSGVQGQMQPDARNLFRQGLVDMKSVPHEERGSRHLLTLTKLGHRFLAWNEFAGKEQALHFGFAKPSDAHHDADLYRLYQNVAQKIERSGGRKLRVVLEQELKKRLNQDLAKLGPDGASPEAKRGVAEQHGLQVVSGKIPLPDVRIEYDTPEGERARMDIELATNHYRGRHLAEKVRAGFSIYARLSDISNLRRVLDQRELTAEILAL